MKPQDIRVLHCPDIVGGLMQQLARSEREVGLSSWAISLPWSPFGYDSDEIFWRPHMGAVARQLQRLRLARRAFRDFDIIHFNFGQSLVPAELPPGLPRTGLARLLAKVLLPLLAAIELQDVALLRRAGKGVVVTFQGFDALQGDRCRQMFPIHFATEVEPGYFIDATDRSKRRRIRKWDRMADRIFAVTPDLMNFLPTRTKLLPHPQIDLRDWVPPATHQENPVPLVIHAPSHRGMKGTRFVLQAVQRLKDEGLPFEFRLIEGLHHREARRLYERADLLIDQLLAGWYGGLAVELMALGKPAICYLREEDFRLLPPGMAEDLPLINATPDSVCSVLREWLTHRRGELSERGARSRKYVEQWHDPLNIAHSMAAEYEQVLREWSSVGRRGD